LLIFDSKRQLEVEYPINDIKELTKEILEDFSEQINEEMKKYIRELFNRYINSKFYNNYKRFRISLQNDNNGNF